MNSDHLISEKKIDLMKLKKDLIDFITERNRMKELTFRRKLFERGIIKLKVKDPNQILIPFQHAEKEVIDKEIGIGVEYFIETLLINDRRIILKDIIENAVIKN